MPTLTLRKTTHSVHPWRLGLLHADGRWQAIEHLTFPRKKDAVPALAALELLACPWDVPPAQWQGAVRAQAVALTRQAPGWAVHARGLIAREGDPHATP